MRPECRTRDDRQLERNVVAAEGQRKGTRLRFRFAQGRVAGMALCNDAHAFAFHAAQQLLHDSAIKILA